MNFYNNMHPYYCGIDLHARLLYVCIIDNTGLILVHQKIKDDPVALLHLLEPLNLCKYVCKLVDTSHTIGLMKMRFFIA